MPAVPQQQIKLDWVQEAPELANECHDLWKFGYDANQTEMHADCYDAYTQTFKTPVADEESWIDDLRMYLPVTQMLVDTLRAAMINIMFPNDRYVSIENEIVGEFLTDILLQNFDSSNWITNTHESILQAAICGDNFSLIRSKGPYFEAVPISLNDIRVFPLHKDLSQTNKVILLRKSAYELANNPSVQYIAEGLQKLIDQEDTVGDDKTNSNKKQQAKKNEYRRSDDQKIGKGHLLLECHIPYFKFARTGRIARNIIVTVIKDTQTIVRYIEQESDELADMIVKTGWSQNTPNAFWTRGVVEPVLSIQSFMNSTLTNELVGGYLDNMGGIMFDPTDPRVREYSETWENSPNAKWAVPAGANIQAIPRMQRRPFAFEYLGYMKQELLEVTNAQQPMSGGQSNVKFATVANIQFQAANGRVAATAAHWDEHYIKKISYKIIQGIYNQMFQVVPGQGMYGNAQRIPNMQAIVFWMKKVGYDDKKIFTKLSDPAFMKELATPIEMTQIRPTGTKTTTNRLEKLDRFERYIKGILETPAGQFGKWHNIPKIWSKLADIPEAEDTYYTMEEIQEQAVASQNQANGVQIPPEAANEMNPLMGMAA